MKSGLCRPLRCIFALKTLRLNEAAFLGAVTDRKFGKALELDAYGVLVTVIDGGRLVRGGEEFIDGLSTTRVVYCERPCVCKLKLPSSRGK